MSVANSLQHLNQSVSEFWAMRDMRERMMLGVAAATVVLGLIYALLIAPALAGRQQMSKGLPVLRQQLAQIQALAKEAATLAAQPASPPTTVSRESIAAALTRNGLKTQNVTLSDNQWAVHLTDASFAAMLAWLNEMQSTARLSVIEANIVVLAQPDRVNAKLTLHQPQPE